MSIFIYILVSIWFFFLKVGKKKEEGNLRSPMSKTLRQSWISFFSSKMYVSICRADVSLMTSGPLFVPFPKLVVTSTGAPYNTTSESKNEIVCGISAKLHFDGVFSGLTNNGSKISNTLFNGKFENDTN